MSGKPSCGSCRFWQFVGEAEEDAETMGDCRRYAPRPTKNDDLFAVAYWPMTNAHDWCGEYAEAVGG
jgi:hypothetical protein